MKIEFDFPTIIHPTSDDTQVDELARELEARHAICQRFAQWLQPRFNERLREMLMHGVEISPITLSAWVKDQWHEYGVDGNFGVSHRAEAEGRPPFIDTGTYMNSMLPCLVFTDEERAVLGIRESELLITR